MDITAVIQLCQSVSVLIGLSGSDTVDMTNSKSLQTDPVCVSQGQRTEGRL